MRISSFGRNERRAMAWDEEKSSSCDRSGLKPFDVIRYAAAAELKGSTYHETLLCPLARVS
jgi:hypothetical protein